MIKKLALLLLLLPSVTFANIIGGIIPLDEFTIVTSSANITDESIVIGDGGVKGVQESPHFIDSVSGETIFNTLLDGAGDQNAVTLNYEADKSGGKNNGWEFNYTPTASPGASRYMKFNTDGGEKLSFGTDGTIRTRGAIKNLTTDPLVLQNLITFSSADTMVEICKGSSFTNSTGAGVGVNLMLDFSGQTSTASAKALKVNPTLAGRAATGDVRLVSVSHDDIEVAYIDDDGTFQNSGGRIFNVTTVNTATYTILPTDYMLDVTYSATAACTITIPSALIAKRGWNFEMKDGGFLAGTNTITFATEAGELIEGSASDFLVTGNGDSFGFFSDGTNLKVTR
jgi:hypothetical protein